MKILIPALSLMLLAITGCQKSVHSLTSDELSATVPHDFDSTTTGEDSTTTDDGNNNSILVDASKDGGTWWFPQGPPSFSAAADHQGKALADYLRSIGYHVDELPRGAVITDTLLKKYSKIIRSAPFFEYTDEELNAYKNFMNRQGAILLFQDHLSYDENDKISQFLGLEFKGAVDGNVTIFANNAITNDVDPFYYIAGAVVTNSENNPDIKVLASVDKASYSVLNNADPFNGIIPDNGAPVMGLVTNFPNTKILFMGDINSMESVPQPLTGNIVNWLFK
jgi:hypothetical protein